MQIDICDPRRRFGTDVPKLALQNPLLKFAILAFASRDWLRVNGEEDLESDKYSSQALQLLIPILDRPVELLDETVLAAIVLLRLYEETIDVDTGTHLLGSARLLNSPSAYADRGGLSEAASWIALRQQLYLSTTYFQPVSMDLDYFARSYSFKDSSPESFTNRIILLCCRVLTYSHNTQGRFGVEDWTQLRNEVLLWYDSITWPVKPNILYYFIDGVSGSLPNLWVPMPVHAIAYQHFYFALLLLAMYEPRNWIPGKEALLARRKVDDQIQQNLAMIAALAISNPEVITASLTAHHILYAYWSSMH
ncbi:hypothetical protein F5X68DRAFT_251533 [Plectosphaerella plurivora]|uniref:Zn(II)2Cys6 transcription factor n=1 Tax=Plectosphaerella plurivora TaxID=936078 RepID=A0A9P8V0V5_9PEZI|nr:hypothetical protein F5X68DRAFT_251533 [Plectosphaerella plurivora]